MPVTESTVPPPGSRARGPAALEADPVRSSSRAPGSAAPEAPARVGVTVYGCGPDEAALVRDAAARLGVDVVTTPAPPREENASLALRTRCVSVGHKTHVSGDALLALRRAGVELVSSRSVGLDHVDVAYAESIGLRVRNVAYSPDGVADFTAMLVLMAVRGARATLRRVDSGDLRLGDPGVDMRDLTVGVVGTGRIGQAVARRLQAFGCRVVAHDHRPKARLDYVPLDELLGLSDVVTLHTPLTPSTRHLLNRERIALMKPTAVVVNTSRGGLVDTGALLAALESGRLGGAALDVLEGEEAVFYADHRGRPVDHPHLTRLLALPNVIVTPHAAFHTRRALRQMVEGSLGDCARFVAEAGRER